MLSPGNGELRLRSGSDLNVHDSSRLQSNVALSLISARQAECDGVISSIGCYYCLHHSLHRCAGIREPVSGSLIYGNNIISAPTAVFVEEVMAHMPVDVIPNSVDMAGIHLSVDALCWVL